MPQFQNLYVGLDENGEVVTWHLRTSTGYDEIDDLVLDLKETVAISGDTLERILPSFLSTCASKVRYFSCSSENRQDSPQRNS